MKADTSLTHADCVLRSKEVEPSPVHGRREDFVRRSASGIGVRRTTLLRVFRAMRWIDSHIPLGVRLLGSGLVFAAGLLGIVPFARYTLIPIGAVAILMEVPDVQRYLLARLLGIRKRARQNARLRRRPEPPPITPATPNDSGGDDNGADS